MAEEGLSVLAVKTDTGEICGAFLNEDYCAPDPPEFDDFLATVDGDWVPCLTMIGELEEKFDADWNVPKEKPPGKWFHMWMGAVAPEGRGNGVARNLARLSGELAKSKGYLCAFGECTGGIATTIMTKYTGADVEAFIDYATWNGCETADILRALPSQGHPGMSLTVIRF